MKVKQIISFYEAHDILKNAFAIYDELENNIFYCFENKANSKSAVEDESIFLESVNETDDGEIMCNNFYYKQNQTVSIFESESESQFIQLKSSKGEIHLLQPLIRMKL